MIRVALKGLAARPLRTALTTLAIVIGVAFVCAAYTLTDTMSGAADSLTHAAYDGTDAVVVTKTAFRGSQTADIRARAPTIPADDARAGPRHADGVDARGRRHHRHRADHRHGRQAGRDRAVLRRRLRRAHAGRRAADAVPAARGPWATGPGPGRDRPRHRESQDYAVGDTSASPRAARRQAFTVSGIANFADVKSLGKASAAIFDLEAARTLFAKDGYDRILVARRRATRLRSRGGRPPRSAAPPTTTASRSTRSRRSSSILRTVLLAFAGVAVLVGAFTIFNSLSITVAQRTKEFGLLRMVGATRRQVRAACCSRRC